MAAAKSHGAAAISDRVKEIFARAILAASKTPPFAEHCRVKAVCDIHESGEIIPAGSTGTIVHVICDGLGYEVEFTSPKLVVVSAVRSELDLA
ncbi:hypothetical protein [Methylocystis sp.]|uniref:hypothetical protein n=1 Tax=Methylocystis sp. TaxID=1911079 RepID=UPI0025CCACA9|nr:hypothetical protein [Methylocystis sp.]